MAELTPDLRAPAVSLPAGRSGGPDGEAHQRTGGSPTAKPSSAGLAPWSRATTTARTRAPTAATIRARTRRVLIGLRIAAPLAQFPPLYRVRFSAVSPHCLGRAATSMIKIRRRGPMTGAMTRTRPGSSRGPGPGCPEVHVKGPGTTGPLAIGMAFPTSSTGPSSRPTSPSLPQLAPPSPGRTRRPPCGTGTRHLMTRLSAGLPGTRHSRPGESQSRPWPPQERARRGSAASPGPTCPSGSHGAPPSR
jgi:hypothetical protein